MSSNVVKGEEPRNYLLVEGKDDMHVFYSLLEHHKMPKQFKIKEKEGIDNLLDTFDVELSESGLGRLGIVVDADTDLASRWLRLRDILRTSGYSAVPINPESEGTIIEESGRPIVGIWLMPDNMVSGMLEDFVSFLRPQDDLLWPMAEDIVQKVKVIIEEDRRFRDVYESKAHIHTWLAWQKEPGKPLGQAITARYLDADAPHAQQLMDWIRKLFDLEAV
jgi:hypothetical protein